MKYYRFRADTFTIIVAACSLIGAKNIAVNHLIAQERKDLTERLKLIGIHEEPIIFSNVEALNG